jgi:signal transduction histidine kinase
MSGAMALRADRLFRLAGFVAALWTGASSLITILALGPAGLAAASGKSSAEAGRTLYFSGLVVVTLLTAAVAGIFLWLTSRPSTRRGSAVRLAVVVVQGLLGIVGDADLLILIAAEIPFVLTPRRARWYFLAQLVAFASLGAGFHAGVAETPLMDVAPVIAIYWGWQIAAFLLGTLAAREAGQRRELARLNAELGATCELLAEGSRLAERLHLSRELHDGLGHRLAALSVNLDVAARLSSGAGADELRHVCSESRRLYQQVRAVVGTLRRDSLIDLRRPLIAMVSGFAADRVTIDLPGELTVDGVARGQALVRCLHSTIARALAAHARRVALVAASEQDGLKVEVRCDLPVRPAEWDCGELEEAMAPLGGHVAAEGGGRGAETLVFWLPQQEMAA